mgnify:CR=1 FL=1
MNIVKFVFNPLQENTYLAWDSTLECVVIDAGNASAKEDRTLSDFIAEQGLTPVAAVNTHGHFDHIMGVSYVKNRYNVPFAASSADGALLAQGAAHAMMFGVEPSAMPEVVDICDGCDSLWRDGVEGDSDSGTYARRGSAVRAKE